MTPAVARATTLTILISQIRAGDRLTGYPECGKVKRVYEYKGVFGAFPVIEFENGTKVFPRNPDEPITVEREKGGDA